MDMTFRPVGATPVAFSGDRVGKTFDEAAKSYLAHGGEAKFLSKIVEYFKGVPLDAIFPAHLMEMAVALYPTQTGATRNRQALAPARAVINHAYDYGWCNLIRLKRFKEEKPKRRPAATAEWMILFLRQCKVDNLLTSQPSCSS